MKKYLANLLHGLGVYVAAVAPQVISHRGLDSSLLIALVPGLVASIASAFLPKKDVKLVEKIATDVTSTVASSESRLAPVATTPIK